MTDNLVIRCVSAGESDTHYHKTWPELAACVGTYATLDITVARYTPKPTAAPHDPASVPVTATPAPATPPSSPVKRVDARPTVKQLNFIDSLGGSWRDAALDNRATASKLIEVLKPDDEMSQLFKVPNPFDVEMSDEAWDSFPQERAWIRNTLPKYWSTPELWDEAMWRVERGVAVDESPMSEWTPGVPTTKPPVAAPVSPAPAPAARPKSKLEPVSSLFKNVPDGYYAVDTGDGKPIKFVRISTYRKNHPRAGSRKLQTIHGPNLEDAACIWTSGKVSVWNSDIDELGLHILSDHAGCLRRYAREIDKCCRCNTRLTDERSRRFGIGPECEKHWPWIIEMALLEEAENGAN